MNIVKIFKDWWNNETAASQKKILRNERERISLKEMDGRVFVMCAGVAVEELPVNTTVQEINHKISGMRDAAMAYKMTDWQASEPQSLWQPRTEMITVVS